MRKIVLLLLLSFGVALILMGCNNKNEESISKNEFLLDTIVTIKLYDVPQSKESVIDESFALIRDLENLLSVHIETSDLYQLKENAGVRPVKVNEKTMEVLKKSMEYSVRTNGKFDITAGPLIDLWKIDPPNGYVPTEEELNQAKSFIDYRKLILNEEEGTAYLEDKGMIANLGAIAKGFIADQVKILLLEKGIKSAIINLGGNVLLVGGRPDGQDFRIGVQDPDAARNTYLGVIPATDQSLVSSGDYERYFEQDGVRYHHILDPDTGFPSDTEVRQVSIVSPESVDGDALSTTLFLLGMDQGIALIESMEDVDAVFVTKDNKVVVTSGLRDRFEFNEAEYGDTFEVQYR